MAGILHAAMAFGSQLWNGGPGGESGGREVPSVPELSGDLMELFSRLNSAGVPYLLVGGIAMLKYIEGRNTDDVDLIIAVEALDRLPELHVEERTADTAKARFRSLRVDLLFTSNPVFHLVQRSYSTRHRFGDLAVPCATVEGLVLLKFYALPSLYRQSQLQRAALYETDIAMLSQRYHPAMAALLDAVRPYVALSEFQELGRIADEIAQRVARMERTMP